MPTYYARKSGNINATDVWATTPTGTAAAVTFASGDVLVANSFTVTVNVSTNLGSTGEVRNDTTGGATGGGSFTLNDGVTLTANVIYGNVIAGINYSGTTSATLVGNLTVNGGRGAHSGTGTLNIIGNISGANAFNTAGFYITAAGTINITGNVSGGSNAAGYGLWTGGTPCTINITGNCTGGTLGVAINNTNNSAVTVIGNCIGGTGSGAVAISNSAASNLVTINGQATGGTQAPAISNTSTGKISVTRAVGNAFGPGNTAGLTAQVGIANSGLGIVEIEQLEYGTFGQTPTSGTGIRLKKVSTNAAVFNYVDSGAAKTLVDATQGQMPAASDVRHGISYASGALTGTCAVPAPGSVALGVPVDNTTGTAVLTAAAVQSALTSQGLTTARAAALDNLDATVSSRLAPSGTLATVTTLTNAPTVPSAAAIASQVRTELGTELGRIDAAISSRATPANIPTSDITAIKAKTDNLPAAPAAVSNIPTAAANATAVWSAATRTLTSSAGITASDVWSHATRTLTSASGPTASEIRTEIDANSTQLAAIKSKTDALNTDRLAQVSTVSTTGAQLAAALS